MTAVKWLREVGGVAAETRVVAGAPGRPVRWRPIADVRPGDFVRVRSLDGRYRYARVRRVFHRDHQPLHAVTVAYWAGPPETFHTSEVVPFAWIEPGRRLVLRGVPVEVLAQVPLSRRGPVYNLSVEVGTEEGDGFYLDALVLVRPVRDGVGG